MLMPRMKGVPMAIFAVGGWEIISGSQLSPNFYLEIPNISNSPPKIERFPKDPQPSTIPSHPTQHGMAHIPGGLAVHPTSG